MANFASILKITIRRYFYYHKRGDKSLNKYTDEGHNLSASCVVIIKCTYNIYSITDTKLLSLTPLNEHSSDGLENTLLHLLFYIK